MLVTLLPPNDAGVEHDCIAEGVGYLRCSPERPIRAPTRHPGLGQTGTRKTSKSIRCCVSPVSAVGEGKHHPTPTFIYKYEFELILTYHGEEMCVQKARKCAYRKIRREAGARRKPQYLLRAVASGQDITEGSPQIAAGEQPAPHLRQVCPVAVE